MIGEFPKRTQLDAGIEYAAGRNCNAFDGGIFIRDKIMEFLDKARKFVNGVEGVDVDTLHDSLQDMHSEMERYEVEE